MPACDGSTVEQRAWGHASCEGVQADQARRDRVASGASRAVRAMGGGWGRGMAARRRAPLLSPSQRLESGQSVTGRGKSAVPMGWALRKKETWVALTTIASKLSRTVVAGSGVASRRMWSGSEEAGCVSSGKQGALMDT
jgi:hypothetical protein